MDSESFIRKSPSELKCLPENSPPVANFFGKAPETYETHRCGMPHCLQHLTNDGIVPRRVRKHLLSLSSTNCHLFK